MKSVVAIVQQPEGASAQSLSYDYYNIYLPMRALSERCSLFDFGALYRTTGKQAMNAAFLQLVRDSRPDVVMVVPTRDEFAESTIRAAGEVCPTVAYFHDDVWREEYAQHWAKYYTHVVTTDPRGESKFREVGLTNAIYSPRGYNDAIYSPDPSVTQDLEVTFVGGFAPHRAWLVKRLRRAGIVVRCYGSGWSTATMHTWIGGQVRRRLRDAGVPIGIPPHGHISQEAMIDVFRRSKINLNLSNSVSWDARYLAASPRNVVHLMRSGKVKEQIKGRHFEINGSGGFQLSYYVEGLEQCFSIGRELSIFVDIDDLVDKVRYYLKYDAERQLMAQRGLARAQRDHSINRRLADALIRAGVDIGHWASVVPVAVSRPSGG